MPNNRSLYFIHNDIFKYIVDGDYYLGRSNYHDKPYKIHVSVSEASLAEAARIIYDLLKEANCPILKMKIIQPFKRDEKFNLNLTDLKEFSKDSDEYNQSIDFMQSIARYKGKHQFTFYFQDESYDEEAVVNFFLKLEERFKMAGILSGEKITQPDKKLSTFISGRWDKDSNNQYVHPLDFLTIDVKEQDYMLNRQEECTLFEHIKNKASLMKATVKESTDSIYPFKQLALTTSCINKSNEYDS
ncbi:hypothetical protein L3V83_01835 [Thiotrichales bacterium 19X7-9]|nr:hypothetical protein [Thiotrichales bacterium 19X7-9]